MNDFVTGVDGAPKPSPSQNDILSYWLHDGTLVNCTFAQLIEWLKSLGFKFEAPSQPPVNTTPAAPTINANDTNNTLQATHALGASEILISTNGGAFVQYDGGVIQVGDVARAPGYWQFKTKAATGRNESPVASSPAFTVATTYNTTFTGSSSLPGIEFLTEGQDTFSFNHKAPNSGDNSINSMTLIVGGAIVAVVNFNGVYTGSDGWKYVRNGVTYTGTFATGDKNL